VEGEQCHELARALRIAQTIPSAECLFVKVANNSLLSVRGATAANGTVAGNALCKQGVVTNERPVADTNRLTEGGGCMRNAAANIVLVPAA
jgi:hypothetical protein